MNHSYRPLRNHRRMIRITVIERITKRVYRDINSWVGIKQAIDIARRNNKAGYISFITEPK